MATNNAIDSAIPIEVLKGGTNAAAMTITYGVVYYDGSKIVTISALGSNGQVFTSNGPSSPPTFESVVGGGRPNPGFVVNKSFDSMNVTGDGTVYTVDFQTKFVDTGTDFDLATNTFTASSGNIYHFNLLVTMESPTNGSGYVLQIITSNRTYSMTGYYGGEEDGNLYISKPISALADMDSSDIAYAALTVADQVGKGTSITRDGNATGPSETEFSGYIIGI